MKFLLVEMQNGGCDYTIGCGVRITTIEADNMQDAIAKVTGKDIYGDDFLNLDRIDGATLYEINAEHVVDVSDLRHQRDLAATKEAIEKARKEKKELLEKLKKELGED